MPFFGKKKPKALKQPDVLTDKHLKSATSLGGDTANEVFQTKYKSGTGIGDTREGYFKGDSQDTRSRYAVGASSLAKGMGLGQLIPETRYATHSVKDSQGQKHKNQFGAVSAGATGEALAKNVYDTDATQRVHDTHDQYVQANLPGTRDSVAQEMGLKKRQGKKKSDVQYMDMSGAEINDLDLSNPAIQEQLNQLQWFDALIGNTDRHAGNILIDPATNQVTGIDNDMAFSRGIQAKDPFGNTTEDWSKGAQDKFLGLPSQIDRSMADKLLGLDNETIKALLTSSAVPGEAQSQFTDADLQGTYDRLASIQAKVQGMVDNNQVLAGWDQNTYQAAVGEDRGARQHSTNRGGFGSYVQRHHHQLQEATDSNNPLAWRKGHRQQDTTPVPTPPTPVATAPTPVATAPTPAPTPAPSPTWTNGSGSGTPRRSLLGSSRGSSTPTPTPTPAPVAATPALTPSPAKPTGPKKPTYPPPPVPTKAKAPTRGRAGSTTQFPSLGDTLANTPWASQAKRPKQPV